MSRLGIEIAGLRFALEADDPAVAARVTERYRGFEAGPGEAPRRIRVPGPVEAFRAEPTGQVIRDGTRLRAEGAEGWGFLDRKSGDGSLVPHGSMALFDMLLRAEVTLHALERGGMVLHASAVELGGRAHLFPGPSGAGKSTLARKLSSEGGRVLADELVVLLPGEGGVTVHGTPFWLGSRAPAPLAAIWRLERGPLSVRPLDRREALRHLAGNLALVVQGDGEVRLALAAAARAASAVPAFALGSGLADPVRATVEGAGR